MAMELTAFLQGHQQVVESLRAEAEAATDAANAHGRLSGARSQGGGGRSFGGGGGFMNNLAGLGGMLFGGGGSGGSGGGGGGIGGFFGGGGGGFVARLTNLANGAAAAQYLAQIVIGVGQALYGLDQAAQDVTRALLANADAMHTSTGNASRIGLMGGDAGDAIALRNRLTSDPYAMGAAGRMGITAVPGPYGTMDSGQLLIRTLEQLRHQNPQDQQRLMFQMGLERFMPMMRLSERSWRDFKADSALTGGLADRRATLSAEADASSRRLSTAFDNLLQTTSPLTTTLAGFKNGLADVLNFITKHTPRDGTVVKDAAVSAFLMTTGNGIHPGLGTMAAQAYTSQRAREAAGKGAENVERNSQALSDNTVAIARLTQRMEMLGGGDRARSAVPANMMRGDQLWAAVEKGAFPTHSL